MKPDMPIRVRRADCADLPALVALEGASFSGDRLSRRQYRHHLGSATAAVLVVGSGRRLAGSAVLLFRRGARVARLHSLAVDPAARGQGLGSALLEACARRACGRGCRVVRLEVRVDNAAAIALYRRHGFACTGRRAGYYEDGCDAWTLQRALAGAAPRPAS